MLFEIVAERLAAHVPVSKQEMIQALEFPPSSEWGDVAFPCFMLSKLLKKNPNQIALELSRFIDAPECKAEAVGAYLNFRLNRGLTGSRLMRHFLSEQFGTIDLGHGKRVIIDMSSPNIAKPFGMGHLRSTVIGNAIGHILNQVGYEVVRVNHLGDWGTQFGKMIVAYLKWGDPVLCLIV